MIAILSRLLPRLSLTHPPHTQPHTRKIKLKRSFKIRVWIVQMVRLKLFAMMYWTDAFRRMIFLEGFLV